MEENELKRKYQYGWYGTCEDECKALYLDQFEDRDKIESIIRVSLSDGRSFEKFTAYDESSLNWVKNLPENESFDSYINPQFQHLECGMGYLVVRKTDNFETLKIDGFNVGNYNGPSDGKNVGFVALNGCPEATPTPTPAPPYIKIEQLDVDYNYVGNKGEAKIKFKVRLLDATQWQYVVSGDSNTYTVLSQNGSPVLEQELVRGPGDYELTVTGLDSTGKPVTIKNSVDKRFFQVLAPTPTPTPEKTPTPTPTVTPTPSQTPFNCECIPSTHTKVIIQSPQQSAGVHSFNAFTVGDQVGVNLGDFKSGSQSRVNLMKTSTEQFGMMIFGQLEPDNTDFYLKDAESGLCYEATVGESERVADGVYSVIMTPRELPGDCQPTPTPETVECCEEKSESVTLSSDSQDFETDNYVSGRYNGISGKLCWDTIAEGSATDKSFMCIFENKPETVGILVNITMPVNNPVFRFEASDGVCYEAVLNDSSDSGRNTFREIN